VSTTEATLRPLLERLRVVEIDCPACGLLSRLEAPFDLDDFACPECGTHLYPFVHSSRGDIVDLSYLRNIVAACYVDSAAASELIERLYVAKHEGSPTEALIDRGVLIAHAIAAQLRHARALAPWWLWLPAVVHPALGLGWVAIAFGAHHQKKDEVARALDGPLSRRRFDPSRIMSVPATPQLESVLRQTAPEAGWNEVLETSDLAAALGAVSGSSWSLTVDRAERLDGWGEEVADVSDEQLVAEIVWKVVEGPRSESTGRKLRRVTMLNRNRMPAGAQVPSFDEALDGRTSVRGRDGLRPLWGVETLDYCSGRVVWSFVRSSRQGHLSAIQWQTLVRRTPGNGAFFSGRHVDGDDALVDGLQKLAAHEVESTWLERLQLELTPPAWTLQLTLWVLGYLWVSVSALSYFESIDAASWVRAAFLALAGMMALRQLQQQRRPFPHRYWRYEDLPPVARAARRSSDIKAWVQEKLRRLDHGAQPSAFGKHGSLRPAQSLDVQDDAFHIYAQDRALQDAVVAVAESHGIDMGKFKEGLQQINNYGVIAGTISGPVATGPSAQASVHGDEPRKSILPTALKRGHKSAPQQSAAE
jgi:hypothetical protein